MVFILKKESRFIDFPEIANYSPPKKLGIERALYRFIYFQKPHSIRVKEMKSRERERKSLFVYYFIVVYHYFNLFFIIVYDIA